MKFKARELLSLIYKAVTKAHSRTRPYRWRETEDEGRKVLLNKSKHVEPFITPKNRYDQVESSLLSNMLHMLKVVSIEVLFNQDQR